MIEITATQLVFSYRPDHQPVARARPGEPIRFHTHDRFPPGMDLSGLWSTGPSTVAGVTGPVGIIGAMPGHGLAIDVLAIDIDRASGAMFQAPGKGLWPHSEDAPIIRRVAIDDHGCTLAGRTVPLHPHIGRIAVAPAEGEFQTATTGPFGGNMDIPDLVTGTRIILPVSMPDALVTVGDLHAAMGDGECCGSGVEVAGTAVISCQLIEHMPVACPVLVTGEEIMCIGDGETLDEAAVAAASGLVALISAGGLDQTSARFLVSAAGHLRICQAVNPRYTIRAAIARDLVDLSSEVFDDGRSAHNRGNSEGVNLCGG